MNTYPVARNLISIESPDPQAIFDVDLGQHVDFIDFDDEAYKEHLLERGLSEEHLTGHAVRFSHKSWWNPREGYCDVPNKQVRVYISGSSTEGRLDQVVRHEAEHFVSFTERPRKFDLSDFSGVGVNLLLLSGLSTAVTAVAAAKGAEQVTEVSQPITFGYIALAGISFLLYALSPEERRARTAAAEDGRSFVTVEPGSPKKTQ